MIDCGQVKNYSELAGNFGIFKTIVVQILNLLKLNFLIIQELEKPCTPFKLKIITAHMVLTCVR